MAEKYRDNWFPSGKAKVLRNRVFPLVPATGGIVEVGAWEGKSTCFIARAFAPRRILTIDPFTGGVADGTTELAKRRDVEQECRSNLLACESHPRQIDLMVAGWRDPSAMLAVINREPLAFVYVDGEHTEVEVFDNVMAYFPYMAQGGVIAGDDWGNPGVKKGAMRAAKQIGLPIQHEWATWWLRFP
jgi:predicted O-methyltransferase YrrM